MPMYVTCSQHQHQRLWPWLQAGSLASSASEGLAAVRAERQTNAEALRKLMDEQV